MSPATLAGRAVRGVLFDYGLTLVTFARPDPALRQAYRRIAQLIDAAGVGPGEAELLVRRAHDRVEADVGEHARSDALRELDIAGVHSAAYAELGAALTADLVDEVLRIEQEAWWQGMTVGPGVVETLHRLRGAGLRLGVCSNAPYRVESLHGQLDHLGLAACLDSATFSAAVGWRKPAAQLFAAALRALGTTAAETIMVGDSFREDIAGARDAGLRAIRTRQFRDDPAGGADPGPLIDSLAALPAALGLANACS